MKRYMVRRPFKSLGVFYGVGSVITDPTKVKRLKSKINEGKVIIVTEDNMDEVVSYMKSKFGINILPRLKKKPKKEAKPKEEAKPKATVKTSVKKK